MSDVSLSKAVRSNLLHLQNTAKMMDKTQERLATGLKVNSALDNPTNFFTAASLNARSKDLSLLMDAISNGVQTLMMADKGISAISKLVEAAQATARQALQTTALVTVQPREAGSVTSANLTSLTVAGPQPAGPAISSTGNLTAFTASDGTPPSAAEGSADLSVAGGQPAMANGFGDGQTLVFSDGTDTYTFFFHDDDAGSVPGGAIGIDVSGGKTINAALLEVQNAVSGNADGFNDFTIAMNGNDLEFSMGTNTTATLNITGTAGVASAVTGIGGSHAPDPGTPGNTGIFTINGQQVEIEDGDGLAEILIKFENAATASGGANAFTVDEDGGVITITGVGNNPVTIAGNAAILTPLGLSAGTQNSTPPVPTQAGAITINGVSVNIEEGDDITAILGKLNTAAGTSEGENAFTVNQAGGFITIEGVGNNRVSIGGNVATLNALGLAAGVHQGDPTGLPIETVNPKRRELITEYNELIGQISDMTKDAHYNGVNLLNGNNLEVLFNEDGTSKLVIQGVTFDAMGLGLRELDPTDFDLNVDIESVLDSLKTALGDLRGQASRFGSNLTVVEARQNFTKEMRNTLETGAANLTLADTNEEAANMLALQTRQQLSQTALSLASQADQAVLRLFG